MRPKARAGAATKDQPEKIFLNHLELIQRVAASAARRVGFPRQDVEDFISTVQVKLIDDDYAILRKYRGDSSLPGYLTVVVHNLFKDFCNHKLGKYRPSAKAKELGEVAMALERLLVVDRHDVNAAVEILSRREEVEATRDELHELAAQLPRRPRRKFVGEGELQRSASTAPESVPEKRLEDDELAATTAQVEEVLNVALASLGAQDMLMLKMLFRDGETIAGIASALGLEQRPLYTRKAKCLKVLRAALEARGLTWGQVRRILSWQDRILRAHLGPEDDGGEDRP